MSPSGYLALVLHAHLPFIRHPDDPTVMEERWLYEAVCETYLPLLEVFESLDRDAVRFRCTVSLSAPLIHMLQDDLLRERCAAHLDHQVTLAGREVERTEPEPWYQRVARHYDGRLRALRALWQRHDGDLVAAFRRLQDAGRLEVMTSTATHAFFPLMEGRREAMRAQVRVAADQYAEHFGHPPPGMWLGECGYVPGVDALLQEAGVRYFVVDTHALEHAEQPPVFGVHAPVFCPSGVAAFARDPETSELVWSATSGYPGDPHYRDFYRDIGYDLPLEIIGPWVHPEGHRLPTGFKYHAITHDVLHDKWVYDPDTARRLADRDAADFLGRCRERTARAADRMDRPPLVLSPYDAELFGHWWYEGVWFLHDLFRRMAGQDALEAVTPAQLLDRHPTNQVTTPSPSSWGAEGYNAYWLNPKTAWIYRHLHGAADRMVALAERFPDADGLRARTLKQAARELLLAQSSDWAFIMTAGTMVSYAERRTNDHIRRFTRLYEDLQGDGPDAEWLARLEAEDNVFPHLDWRVFRP